MLGGSQVKNIGKFGFRRGYWSQPQWIVKGSRVGTVPPVVCSRFKVVQAMLGGWQNLWANNVSVTGYKELRGALVGVSSHDMCKSIQHLGCPKFFGYKFYLHPVLTMQAHHQLSGDRACHRVEVMSWGGDGSPRRLIFSP